MAKKKWNVVTISTLGTDYSDPGERLLHGTFQIFVDFMEGEVLIPDCHVNYTWAKEWRQWKKEADFLYKWWKEIRPARFDPFIDDGDLVGPLSNELFSEPDEKGNRRWLGGSQEMKKKYPAFYKAMAQSRKLEKKWEEEDQKMLHRLIDIRRGMWT